MISEAKLGDWAEVQAYQRYSSTLLYLEIDGMSYYGSRNNYTIDRIDIFKKNGQLREIFSYYLPVIANKKQERLLKLMTPNTLINYPYNNRNPENTNNCQSQRAIFNIWTDHINDNLFKYFYIDYSKVIRMISPDDPAICSDCGWVCYQGCWKEKPSSHSSNEIIGWMK